MYRICVAWFIGCFLFCARYATAQRSVQLVPEIIQPFRLAISTTKTTNLIFPYAIKSVDRGSSDILVQKAKGVENILQVKADTANFTETNLSIVTSDGKFYSFLLSYAQSPSCLNLMFKKDAVGVSARVRITNMLVGQASYESLLKWVCAQRPFLRKHNRSHKLRIRLRSIYLKDSLLVFGLQLKNASQFAYTPDAIRFVIKNKRQAKRTAIQEVELYPLYDQEFLPIQGNQETTIVLGFKPFTFSENQQLLIQLEERNGGRSVKLPVKLRTLFKARAIPSN